MTFIALALAAATLAAAQPAAPPSTQTTSTRPATVTATTSPDTESAQAPADNRPSVTRTLPSQNVKVDVTITEQAAKDSPVKKTVTLIVASGRTSSVRTTTNVPLVNGRDRDLPFNIDATVFVTQEGRVYLELRFLYTSVRGMLPMASEGLSDLEPTDDKFAKTARPSHSTVQDSLTLLLTPGVPVVAARSADAASDRTVTVEVKAEILK
ncbi:MAG: hypothetical protein IT182_15555 [Acidobacteria bacterium]|nr:hypothetical protein [Acidobacteriota bacterium]